MRALLHVHSDYSSDGVPSLESLAAWGASRGLDAILLSEHTNDFDREKMSRFVAHCEGLAGEPCRLVPGLEFPVRGGFHLLGLSIRAFEPVADPVAAVRFIRDQGGLAVLAHPARYKGAWPDDAMLAELDGLEIWNARYDGRFVPSERVLAASEAVIARQPHLARYCGQDLHATQSHRLLVVEAEAAGPDEFVGRLRSGRVTLGAAGARFKARGPLAATTRIVSSVAHPVYRAARAMREAVRSADGSGAED
jgi:hypothetical protein